MGGFFGAGGSGNPKALVLQGQGPNFNNTLAQEAMSSSTIGLPGFLALGQQYTLLNEFIVGGGGGDFDVLWQIEDSTAFTNDIAVASITGLPADSCIVRMVCNLNVSQDFGDGTFNLQGSTLTFVFDDSNTTGFGDSITSFGFRIPTANTDNTLQQTLNLFGTASSLAMSFQSVFTRVELWVP